MYENNQNKTISAKISFHADIILLFVLLCSDHDKHSKRNVLKHFYS